MNVGHMSWAGCFSHGFRNRAGGASFRSGPAVRRRVLIEERDLRQLVGKAARAPAIHGVSGSYVVLADVNRQGAIWLRRQGLERAYCALQEPHKLGPGYQKANLSFIALAARKAVRRLASAEHLAPAVDYL